MKNPFLLLLLLLVACASPPRGVTPVRSVSVPQELEPNQLVASAENYLGAPYAYGGAKPTGFDCSGLVLRVYAEHGVRLPRTSAEQYRVGASIGRAELRPGDLVFFGAGGRVSHVGIYAGQGAFIHASTSSLRVQRDRIDEGYFRRRYVGARRLFH